MYHKVTAVLRGSGGFGAVQRKLIIMTTVTALGVTSSNAEVDVNSVAGLLSALKTAKAGETIALAPGNYSGLAINGANFTAPVTITSQSTSNEAVLQGFKLYNSSNVTMSNLNLTTVGSGDPYFGFRMAYDTNVTLSNLNVHGSLDNNDTNDTSGFYITGSSNVTIQGSQFQQLQSALGVLNSNQVTISGNQFHDMGVDGIDIGGTSNISISGNSFTNFHSTNAATMHPDAIEFWTANTTASAQNISISNNVITRGNGDMIQGIFMRDTVGNLPFENVSISNNIVMGGMYDGITVAGANGVKMSNNIVTSYNDEQSWIRVQDTTNVSMSQNSASSYIMTDNSGLTQTGDISNTAAVTPGSSTLASILAGSSPLGASAISHTTSLTASLLQMTR